MAKIDGHVEVGKEYMLEIEDIALHPYGLIDENRIYVVVGGDRLIIGDMVNVRILRKNGGCNYIASVCERPPLE